MSDGIYRTMNGNSDELIGIGRCIKAGYACSKVEITNARYDAVIDPGLGDGRLIRVQIKGTSTGTLDFTGGSRSGRQIDRSAPSRTYVYTRSDCDLILGVDSNNGDCYLIPVDHLLRIGKQASLKKLAEYKENWSYLL